MPEKFSTQQGISAGVIEEMISHRELIAQSNRSELR